MPFYEKGDVRIRYEEAGSGFLLFLIPGGGLNSTISFFTGNAPFNAIEEFKDEYRCITMDLRNANGGQSSGPLEIDRPWDAYADDQLGLMDHLGIGEFLVMGFCIGGLRQILTKQQLRKSVRETLGKVITFFHNHRRWMQYDVYLAAGLPVGTGIVESACGSVVKHRMEGEGKRWSLEGAEAILTLRSLKKSHDNDLRDYWKFRARQMRGRLYGRKPKYRPMPRLRRVA